MHFWYFQWSNSLLFLQQIPTPSKLTQSVPVQLSEKYSISSSLKFNTPFTSKNRYVEKYIEGKKSNSQNVMARISWPQNSTVNWKTQFKSVCLCL